MWPLASVEKSKLQQPARARASTRAKTSLLHQIFGETNHYSHGQNLNVGSFSLLALFNQPLHLSACVLARGRGDGYPIYTISNDYVPTYLSHDAHRHHIDYAAQRRHADLRAAAGVSPSRDNWRVLIFYPPSSSTSNSHRSSLAILRALLKATATHIANRRQ